MLQSVKKNMTVRESSRKRLLLSCLKTDGDNHQIEISKAKTDRETYLFSVFMEEKEK